MSVCNKKKQALQQSGVFYTSNKLLPEDCNINIKMQLFSIVSIQHSRVFFLENSTTKMPQTFSQDFIE